ncbi:MAG TPA: hypothetical protein VGM80_13085 [Gaiellaceae bacterium]
MRQALGAALLALACASVVPASTSAGVDRRPATSAERAAILQGAPYLAQVEKCASLTFAVDGQYAAVWLPYSRRTPKCGVDVTVLENPAVLERTGSVWSPLAFPESPLCSQHVPAALVLITTSSGGVEPSACDSSRSRVPTGGFVLPSGNIGCAVTADDTAGTGKPTVHCGIKSGVTDDRWQKDGCLSPGTWQMRLDSNFRASEGCDPLTASAPAGSRVLAYGTSASFGGVRCSSAFTGLTCQNHDGSGFFLSRAAQRSFEHPPKNWRPFGHGAPTSFTVEIGTNERASCDVWTTRPAFVRCDGAVTAPKAKRPSGECEVTGLQLGASTAGKPNCATDSVSFGPLAPLLPQGRTIHIGPFACTSTVSALTCRSTAGHEIALGPGGRWHAS